MTFLSTHQLKLKPFLKTLVSSILVLTIVVISSIFTTTTALANSSSKSDIDYYLQRGFTNDQVVKLCVGTSSNQNNASNQNTVLQSQAVNQLSEDQSYLSAALAANDVTLSNQNLTLLPRECIKYGPPNNADLIETICVDTKLSISLSGMTVGRASSGLLFVKDATVNVKGNIQREFVGINRLRRQDREAILETMKTNPSEVSLSVRRGIAPSSVRQRLAKYSK